MPSQLHEALLLLFRNRPSLAPELLRAALQVNLPKYTEARIDSADLTELQPTEYRADLVVVLQDDEVSGHCEGAACLAPMDGAVLGIVVEVQLSSDERKPFVWPVYVASLRARLECPVCLLVVTADDSVARWAAKSIELGGGNYFAPWVLGPAGVPEITDPAQAIADPELAVLSAMAHGDDPDAEKSVQIALAAQAASLGLDMDRSQLYFDLIFTSLSEAARRALQSMDPAKYEYQSEFAKRYVAQGRAEGQAEGEARGRAALITKQLTLRFGALPATTHAQVQNASIAELEAIGERLLTAKSLKEALGN